VSWLCWSNLEWLEEEDQLFFVRMRRWEVTIPLFISGKNDIMWAPPADIKPTTDSCDFWPLGPTDRLFIADLSAGLLTYWAPATSFI
jgi:hypothetical protein